MISIKDFISFGIIFIMLYFILYIDHKLSPKCKNEKCYLHSNKVSLKTPFIISLLFVILFNLFKPKLFTLINYNAISVRQNIMTDIPDF